MKRNINFFKIFDYIICFMLFVLAIKKGGFYKSDTIFFNLVVNIVAIISIITSYIKNKNVNTKSKIGILSIFLAVAYMLPIIFRNHSSLNDSIFEMIRYFNVYLIYSIVQNSSNKKIYKNAIIIIAIVLFVFGIDQLANGYAVNFLKNFNSGYLTSNNVTRMSSTIQYANVFALICLIGYIFTFDNINNSKMKKYIANIVQFILLSGIILSESRVTIFLTVLVIIYEIIKNKNIDKKHILFNIIYAFVFIVLVNKFINNNLNMIYLITIITSFLNLIFTYILNKFANKIRFEFKNKWINLVYIFIVVIICILCVNLHTDIALNSSSDKSYVTRNIYKFDKENKNILDIEIDELEEDTRYEIGIFTMNNNNESQLIEKLYYYSTTTGKFNINIENPGDLKYINVNIHCTKGSVKVKNISINSKQVAMDYLLLPSNLMYRIIDMFYTSNSLNYRIEYQKDALKIVTDSILNFVFGTGGEGFKNTYNYVKEVNYSSTEVHNIYLQIFVESGIIGLLIFVLLIIYILKNYKMNTSKLALVCIFIHGIFDLDFSYMIVLAIFGILLGTIEQKENKKVDTENKLDFYINYIKKTVGISICAVTTVILIFSNLASCVELYEITNLDDRNSIESKMVNYEKIVKFDMFEYKYRIKLNEAYSRYLEKLSNELDDTTSNKKYNDTINKMLENLGYLQNNECTNCSNLLNLISQYMVNIEYIMNSEYSGDKYIFENIEYDILKLYNSNNSNFKERAENLYINYLDLIKKYNEFN